VGGVVVAGPWVVSLSGRCWWLGHGWCGCDAAMCRWAAWDMGSVVVTWRHGIVVVIGGWAMSGVVVWL
jgi:hypothetical protein